MMGNSDFDMKNKALDFGSDKVFSPGTQPTMWAAAYNDKHIQYAGGKHGSLVLITNDLNEYQQSKNYSKLNTWKIIDVASLFPSSEAANFVVNGAISMVAFGRHNFVFWRDQQNKHWALRSSPDGAKVEVAPVNLKSAPITSSQSITSNLAAVTLPSVQDMQLSSKLGVVALVFDSQPHKGYLLSMVLDPADFTAGQPWAASSFNAGLIQLGGNGSTVARDWSNLSAGWLNQGTLKLSDSDPLKPFFTLVIMCSAPWDPKQTYSGVYSYGMPLLSCFYYDLFRGRSDLLPCQATNIAWNISAKNYGPIRVAPDGSLFAGFVDSNEYIGTAELTPNGTDPQDINHGKPGLYSPKWTEIIKDMDGKSRSMSASISTCSVYIPLPQEHGDSPFGIPSPNNAGKIVRYSNCVLQKYIECTFGSSQSGHLTISTFYWGEVFSVPNYKTFDVIDRYKNTCLLTMVADLFPYPVPQKAVWGSDSPSGMINWLLCTYEYLVGADTAVSVETSLSGSAGIQLSTTIEILGVGAQAESSYAAGYASVIGSSISTHTATSYAVTTKAVPLEPSNSTEASLRISQEGSLFGTAPVRTIGIDLCTTARRGQTSLSGSIAWNVHPVLRNPPSALSSDFSTYCYTPGNPLTYAESDINNRMKILFNGLTDAQKRMFIINGEDYSKLYTDGHYIKNVVKRFGMKTFGPGKNSPYLEFAFSETGLERNEFQSTKDFTHTGGWFVNGSYYEGLAVDQTVTGGLSFLGDINLNLVDFHLSAMAGVNFSGSINTTQSESQTWGVKLSEYLNPLAQGESYTVRMYILKPSPLWAMELKQFGFPSDKYPAPGPDIDLTNSCPIRILFTVSDVSEELANRLRSSTI